MGMKQTINLKGNQYEFVKSRLKRMRDIFPDASIETKIIDMQFNENRYIQSVVVQATITVPGNDGVPDAVAQGLSLAERSKGGQVGFLEKCETAAIGRALASLGFVADGTGYASADEMNQNTTSVEKKEW